MHKSYDYKYWVYKSMDSPGQIQESRQQQETAGTLKGFKQSQFNK